ncbi:MAG: cupin domain-containing protein [Bacteroidota bacterium]
MNTPTLSHEVANATRRLYRGSAVVKFLLSSEDTNNALSIVEFKMLAGTEPPAHIHYNEDEVFIIKQGELTFFIGDNPVKAYIGDVIFAPRGVAHSFTINTESATMLTIMTPGGFDKFFWKQSTPYSAGEPVKPVGPPTQSAINAVVKLAEEFGVRFV